MKNEGQILTALSARTLRELLDKANALAVQRQDIVSVLRDDDGFRLVYYKGNGREV